MLFGHVETVHRIAYVLIGCLGSGIIVYLIGWIIKRRNVNNGYDFKRRNGVGQAVWVDRSDATGFRETNGSQELSPTGSIVSPVVELEDEVEAAVGVKGRIEIDRPDSPVRKVNNIRVVKSNPF